ncbi:MAG: hypothetical protein U0235_32265 [Polyangiaceae bacterium]
MSLRSLAIALSFAVVASAGACSSSSDGSSTPSSSDAGSNGGDDAASSDDAGSSASLKAPTITMVMAMAGGLHVTWTNNQKDCDSIEGERKSAKEAYKVVFTLPDGTVDNKHDAPLTAGTSYTYRVRCKKGTDYSPYSNEKSGTP